MKIYSASWSALKLQIHRVRPWETVLTATRRLRANRDFRGCMKQERLWKLGEVKVKRLRWTHYCFSCLTLSQSHGLQPSRLLWPWNFPGKNTGGGCRFLSQGIFPSQELNPSFLHWQADSLTLKAQWDFHWESPDDHSLGIQLRQKGYILVPRILL